MMATATKASIGSAARSLRVFRVVDYSSFFAFCVVEGCAVTTDFSISRVTATLGNSNLTINAFDEVEFF